MRPRDTDLVNVLSRPGDLRPLTDATGKSRRRQHEKHQQSAQQSKVHRTWPGLSLAYPFFPPSPWNPEGLASGWRLHPSTAEVTCLRHTRGLMFEHANGAVEATTDLPDVARRAAPGDEHDLLRGEAPERVLDRLHRVGVAYRAAGLDVHRCKRGQRERQAPLGVEPRLPEVRQPVGERRVVAGARTRTSGFCSAPGRVDFVPAAAISPIAPASAGSSSGVVTTTSIVKRSAGAEATSMGSSNVALAARKRIVAAAIAPTASPPPGPVNSNAATIGSAMATTINGKSQGLSLTGSSLLT